MLHVKLKALDLFHLFVFTAIITHMGKIALWSIGLTQLISVIRLSAHYKVDGRVHGGLETP